MNAPYEMFAAAVTTLIVSATHAATPLEQCDSYMAAQDFPRAIQAGRVAGLCCINISKQLINKEDYKANDCGIL